MNIRLFLLIGSTLSMRYSAGNTQSFEWARRIGGPGPETCRTMALDGQGNIYLAGTFQGNNVDFDPGAGSALLSSFNGSPDIFLAKYDPAGNYLWAKKIGGANQEIPGEMAVDGSGNVYVAGWYESASCDFDPGQGTVNLSAAGLTDIYFAKYDTNGNYIWAKSMGSYGYDGCHDILIDQSGNIFITGYYSGTVDFDPGPGIFTLTDAGGGDLFFAKFDSSCNLVWAKSAGGSQYEVGNSINTDPSGNIYISGPFMSPDADFNPGAGTALLGTAGGYDMYLAKYDAAGNYLWAKKTGGWADEIGGNIEFDRVGNVYVLGVYQSANIDFDPGPGNTILSSAGGWDLSVSKFNSSGNLLWANGFGSSSDDYYTGLAQDSDGNFYLGGFFSNTIDLDPGTGAERATSAGGFDSFYAKYDSNGTYIWSMTLGGRSAENGGPVAYDPTGHLCTVMTFNGSGVDMDPGLGTATLSSAGVSDLAIIKFSLHAEPDLAGQIAFSNTGPDGNNEIYTIFSDGTRLTKLTNSTRRECGPAWSPDGSKIAFYVHYDDFNWSEFIMDADGSNSRRLTAAANVCDGPPAWSPDGTLIAFGRWYPQENYRAELWMMNADGTNQHRVGTFSGDSPSWSPDGSKIAICCKTDSGSSIATVNPDGTELQEISSEGTENWWPAWSPDGSRIAFQSNRGGNHDIYVIDPDGSNPVKLTDHPGEDGDPDWSPDGTHIAYSAMVNGRYEIHIMHADGTRPVRLVNSQVHNINPAWKPVPVSSSVKNDRKSGSSLKQNYPNPTRGLTMIEFSVEKEGPAILKIMDLHGKEILTRNIGKMNAGINIQSVDLSGLAPGQYLYTVISDRQEVARMLIKY